MKLAGTLSVAIVFVLVLGAVAANANFKGKNGLVAFDSWTGTSQDIGVFDPNGSGFTLLTNTPDFSEQAPRWSPEGTKIAYMGHPQFGEDDQRAITDIWVMDANGEHPTQVTNTSRREEVPAWTADGRIVYCGQTADDLSNWEIYVINVDGTGLKRLTNSPGLDCWPSPAPFGSKVAFTTVRNGTPEIYVVNLNGTGERKLVDGYISDWSPSGNDIVFERDDANGIGDVWISHADGTAVRRLTTTATTESFPSWSPDGTTIVFGRIVDPGIYNIYSHDPVTGEEHLLLADSPPTTYSVAYPTWQALR
jgi:Tol biopolymer transport system component